MQKEQKLILPSEVIPTLTTEPNVREQADLLFGTRLDLKEDGAIQYRLARTHTLQDIQAPGDKETMQKKQLTDRPLGILLPDDCFVVVWGVFKDFAIVYSVMTTLFFLAFEEPGLGMFIVDVIVWAFFVVDIPLRFLNAYENDRSRLVTNRRQIATHYMRSWFLLDLLAIVPLQFADWAEIEYYFRLVRLLKINSALNLLDGEGIGMIIPFFMTRVMKNNGFMTLKQKHFTMIFNILLFMIFLTYSMACMWFWYSQKTRGLTAHLPELVSVADKMPETSSWEKMQRMWYFMITTLTSIGYGDFGAYNICEMILLMVILLVGVSTYSYIISNFGMIAKELDEMEGDRVSGFVLWLKRLEAVQGKLPNDFKTELIHTFTLYDRDDRLKLMGNQWWKCSNSDEMTALEDPYLAELPEEVVADVKKHLFSDIFGLYRGYFGNSDFAQDVSLHFHPRHFQVGELLLEEGQGVSEVMFQLKGHIGVGPLLADEVSIAVIYEQRCVVGDYAALRGVPSFTNYKVVGNRPVLAAAIPALVFVKVLAEKYPDLTAELHIQSTQRFNALTELIRDHFALVQRKTPKLLHLDTRYWVPSVEKILDLHRSKARKERDFVTITQRNLIKSYVPKSVEKILSQGLTTTLLWRQAMEEALKHCHTLAENISTS